MRYTILLVDDNEVNRRILKKILVSDYDILEAENGKVSLELVQNKNLSISAIILDLRMPVMDGFEVLKKIMEDDQYRNIPIVVATGNSDNINEAEALKLGAWDFISKPYNPVILKFRLKNAIERSKLHLFEQLRHQAEHDELTELYNAKRFYQSVEDILHKYPEEQFVMIRFDIDRFKQFNSLYGSKVGDQFLIYIAQMLVNVSQKYPISVYSRIGTDVFAVCVKYVNQDCVLEEIRNVQKIIGNYITQFDILAPFGLYYIDDRTLPVNEMLDRATLAAKTCKGKYIDNIAVYTEQMGERLRLEQEITSEMVAALEAEEFCVYYQPKYNIATSQPIGAEALVRWKHPKKGMISPALFIPTFEKNGFIAKVDYFVWEKTCQYLRNWIDMGLTPHPISVNVSRTNLNNPNIVNLIHELVVKYNISPNLLQLEITESAYMDNPEIMKHIVNQFHEYGFTLLMDDFGSGYSSLNTLKDIAVDILKIDMKFLPTGEKNPKSEKILASVIRMADWIGMPTIVEGVENQEQCDYLKSVGCIYVQGFYYGRPMPMEDYYKLMVNTKSLVSNNNLECKSNPQFDALLSADPQTEALLSGLAVPVAIYEYGDDRLDRIRVNQCFYDVFGYRPMEKDANSYLSESEYAKLKATLHQVASTHLSLECEISFDAGNGAIIWYRAHLRHVLSEVNGDIICAVFINISQEKQIEQQMEHITSIVNHRASQKLTMLIVDDTEISREMLKIMFEEEFEILEASNGAEGLEILKRESQNISIILLDMIMPEMDGAKFLELKNLDSKLQHVPVIIISADKAEEMQVNMLRMGVNDYITKPFVPEMTVQRVHNVLEYQNRFIKLIGEYNQLVNTYTKETSE